MEFMDKGRRWPRLGGVEVPWPLGGYGERLPVAVCRDLNDPGGWLSMDFRFGTAVLHLVSGAPWHPGRGF